MSEYIPPPPPSAGWYPDPSGQPGRRFHDGATWTHHFTPDAPAPATPTVVVNNHVNAAPAYPMPVIVTGKRTNHVLHLVLTFLTAGLWLPVWVIVAIANSGNSNVAVGGVMQTARGLSPKTWKIIGGVFVALFIMGLISETPALLGLFIPLAIIGGGCYFFFQKKAVRDEEAQKLAMRAEYENSLQTQGDPRGTHGRFPPAVG